MSVHDTLLPPHIFLICIFTDGRGNLLQGEKDDENGKDLRDLCAAKGNPGPKHSILVGRRANPRNRYAENARVGRSRPDRLRSGADGRNDDLRSERHGAFYIDK